MDDLFPAKVRPASFAYLLPFALAAMGPWALAWAVATLFVRDVVASVALRGLRELHRPMLYGWLREVVVLAVWAAAPLKRHVSWRGHRVRVGEHQVGHSPLGRREQVSLRLDEGGHVHAGILPDPRVDGTARVRQAAGT